MDVKNQRIAAVAIAELSRTGLAGVTMGDLARAAGVSRQTIYNTYGNREEVLRDAIRLAITDGITRLHAGWLDAGTLADKIDVFYKIGPLDWFDMIQSAPDAADLIAGLNAAGSTELAEGSVRWKTELSGMFEDHAAALAAQGLTPADAADLLYASSYSAKVSAVTRPQLVTRLAALKAAILALVGESVAPAQS